jgi:hypothetical protein
MTKGSDPQLRRLRGDQIDPANEHDREEYIDHTDSSRAIPLQHICALTPDRGAVYRYSGSGTSWWKIHSWGGIELYGGVWGLVIKQLPNGALGLYVGPGDLWRNITHFQWIAADAECALTGNQIYASGSTLSGVYIWNKTGQSWTRVGRPAGRIYGGRFGLVATDPTTGHLFLHLGGVDNWRQIGFAGASFAVTSNTVFGLTPDKSAVYRYDGFGMSWTKVGGPTAALYAGDWGLVATAPNGNVFRYLGSPGNWQHIGGPGAQFAVSSIAVFGLTPDKSAVYRYDGAGTSWTYVGGPAYSIVAAGGV